MIRERIKGMTSNKSIWILGILALLFFVGVPLPLLMTVGPTLIRETPSADPSGDPVVQVEEFQPVRETVGRVGQRVNTMVDQSVVADKARRLASTGILRHSGRPAGDFEGIGVSDTPDVPTCEPPGPDYHLSGDATVFGRGKYWRVRSWRK